MRPHGLVQPDQWGKFPVAKASRKNKPRRAKLTLPAGNGENALCKRNVVDLRIGMYIAAMAQKPVVQAPQKIERIDVAVGWTP